ncbi:orexigenic neuropeptide QRFP isoform X1 [Arapaima gigas]
MQTWRRQMRSTCPLYILLLLEVGNFYWVDGTLEDRADFQQSAWSVQKMPNIVNSIWSAHKPFRETKSDFAKWFTDALKGLEGSNRDLRRFHTSFDTGPREETLLEEPPDKGGKRRSSLRQGGSSSVQTHKRTSDLENLAEGLNEYRSKGGFTFRFGRK